jgi:gamma-glutamylcyclotransferase (GGCT)/AIG2-like uncharacterized protein YtfP
MLYFAYGSNMDPAQLAQRCPSARFIAVAKLPDHRLAFTRFAKDRGCGTCDGIAEPGQAIWGIVFDISEANMKRLDECEGFQPGRPLSANCYVREQRRVCRDGDSEKPLLVWLYCANRQPNAPLPNVAYKKQLVDGASFWRLPASYQAQLERIQTA